MLSVRPPAKPRATGLGRKRSRSIAASTARFFSSLTVAVPLRIRETVLGDTPANCATMSRVTTPSAAERDVVAGDLLRRGVGGLIRAGQ